MVDDQALIERIKAKAYDPARATTMRQLIGVTTPLHPPATPEQIAADEALLGFRLPDLIREIYLQVGNGGFGPGYGLFGVSAGTAHYDGTLAKSSVALRTLDPAFLEDEGEWLWKHSYIIYGYWGCNVTTVVDCADPALPIFSLDGTMLAPHSSGNLRQWWLDWLEDRIEQY